MRNLLLAAVVSIGITGPAAAQGYYLGEIIYLASNFCPQGTLAANGTIYSITSNVALFSLLGNNYGGNGTSNFAVPNVKPVLTANRFPLTACIVSSGYYPSRP